MMIRPFLAVVRIITRQFGTTTKSSMPTTQYSSFSLDGAFNGTFREFAHAISNIKPNQEAHPTVKALQDVIEFRENILTPTKAFILENMEDRDQLW